MGIQFAKFKENSAYLNTEFGLNLAIKKLGMTAEEIESIVGRYTRGQRKGELKGKLVWFKVIEGGWIPEIRGVCRKPNLTYGYHVEDYNGNNVIGGWVQTGEWKMVDVATMYYIFDVHNPETLERNKAAREEYEADMMNNQPKSDENPLLAGLLEETKKILEGKNQGYNDLDAGGKNVFLNGLKLALKASKPEKGTIAYESWGEVYVELIDVITELNNSFPGIN